MRKRLVKAPRRAQRTLATHTDNAPAGLRAAPVARVIVQLFGAELLATMAKPVREVGL